MAISMVEIRGHYEDAHRTLRTGSVTLTPSFPISNGTTLITQVPVTADLVNGNVSITVAADDDTGTTPTGMVYTVTETLDVPDGPPLVTKYLITVSASNAATGIDLATAPRAQVTLPQYAAYLTQITGDARYLQSVGGTLTGALTLPALKMTTGPANGAVLTSDSSGNAAWQVPGAVSGVDWINVKTRGAKGDGVTDDLTALQAAIDAAAAAGGGTVYLPYGVYRTSNAIVLKTGVTLRGAHAASWPFRFPSPLCSIKPTAAFAGECVISMLGKDITGSANNEGNCRISDLELDGSAMSTGSVSGIHAQGEVLDVTISRVTIKNMTHNGIHTNIGSLAGATRAPHDWFMDSVVCVQNAGFGFSMSMTDGWARGCIASTNGSDGWLMGPYGSFNMDSCQALFNGRHGLNINGGAQVGNLAVSGFLTDRNQANGVQLGQSTGSGSGPILFSGLTLNRDGKNANNGGGGYAGLNINGCANPVIIEGVTVNTGVDDDGTGVNSPQYGIALSGNAYVAVGSGYVHGNTTGWYDDGTNTVVRRGINIGEATGPKATPTFVYTNGVTTTDGNLEASGRALGIPRPRDHGAIAWTMDARAVRADKLTVNGTLYLAALYVPRATTATKLVWGINVAGATPVAGQNFVGLYNAAGTQVASVGVDARVATTGPFTETINTPLTPGMYWVAFLFNAATLPRLYVGGDLSGALLNWNLSAATLAFATNGTALTALPASITPASNAVSQFCLFAAVA